MRVIGGEAQQQWAVAAWTGHGPGLSEADGIDAKDGAEIEEQRQEVRLIAEWALAATVNGTAEKMSGEWTRRGGMAWAETYAAPWWTSKPAKEQRLERWWLVIMKCNCRYSSLN